jgi:integrase
MHAAGCFLSYLERQGLSLADPGSWKAYAQALHRPLTVRNHAGRKKLTAGGYNNRIQAARKVVKLAIDLDSHLAPEQRERLQELAKANLPRMKDRRTGVSEERFITRDQVLAMIQAAQAPTWGGAHNHSRQDLALWIEFLWTTGARISEATGILLNEINDVDHATVRILLHGKGGLDRTVYCPRELVDRIRAHFLGQEYLFASKDVRSEGRYSRQHISNLIHTCGKKALGHAYKEEQENRDLFSSPGPTTFTNYTSSN